MERALDSFFLSFLNSVIYVLDVIFARVLVQFSENVLHLQSTGDVHAIRSCLTFCASLKGRSCLA